MTTIRKRVLQELYQILSYKELLFIILEGMFLLARKNVKEAEKFWWEGLDKLKINQVENQISKLWECIKFVFLKHM